jgi:hypothetical protein
MFDVKDLLIDILGAFAGAFLYINVSKKFTSGRPQAGNIPEVDDV